MNDEQLQQLQEDVATIKQLLGDIRSQLFNLEKHEDVMKHPEHRGAHVAVLHGRLRAIARAIPESWVSQAGGLPGRSGRKQDERRVQH